MYFTERYVIGENNDKSIVYNVLNQLPEIERNSVIESIIFLMPFEKPVCYLKTEIVDGRSIVQFSNHFIKYSDPEEEHIISHEIAHFILKHECYGNIPDNIVKEQDLASEELAKKRFYDSLNNI
ncbi:MAG: hypothetical protein QHH74_10060 [Spirochaetota bacterium]|mgnify:CR=1 FL=1|nr:hypothetical protein [Spirochaetota bacterium]